MTERNRGNGRQIHKLLTQREPLPPLVPGTVWNDALTSQIQNLEAGDMVKAGLHLWNDDIQRCHTIVQPVGGHDASYWHAILHRRESDYGNSRYWYRQAGNHPVHSEMKAMDRDWDPFRFVDLCQEAEGGKLESTRQLEEVQAKEMDLLLKFVLKNDIDSF